MIPVTTSGSAKTDTVWTGENIGRQNIAGKRKSLGMMTCSNGGNAITAASQIK